MRIRWSRARIRRWRARAGAGYASGMARFTAQGVEPKSLSAYRADLEQVFRDALGASLDLAADSPQGQLIGLLALAFEQLDETVVTMANAFSLQRATGAQLDDLASILGIRREVATRSTVTATVMGRSGTTVLQGWRAKTTQGSLFRAKANTLITGGTAQVEMESVETGAVTAPAGSLTALVDLTPGIDSVSNSMDASLGQAAETDAAFRRRYAAVCTRQSAGTVDAIIAQVLSASGVKAVQVRENATNATVTIAGQSVGAHSIFVVADGGTNAAVAAAIAASKPAAVGTAGAVSVQHQYGFAQDGGPTETIRFSRPNSVTVTGTVTGTLNVGFPADGVLRIQQAASTFIGNTPIGQTPDLLRYQSAMVQAVPGWRLTAYTLLAGGTDMTQSSYSAGGTDRFALAPSGLTVNLS